MQDRPKPLQAEDIQHVATTIFQFEDAKYVFPQAPPEAEREPEVSNTVAYINFLQVKVEKLRSETSQVLHIRDRDYRVYRPDIQKPDEQFTDPNEPLIQLINYFQAALFILLYSSEDKITKDKKAKALRTFFNNAKALLMADKQQLENKTKIVDIFRHSLRAVLKLKQGATDLEVARELVWMTAVPEMPVCTARREKNREKDNITLNLSEPVPVDKQRFEAAGLGIQNPKDKNAVENQYWFKEATQKLQPWFKKALTDRKLQEVIINRGASASTSGRIFPWQANAKKEHLLVATVTENRLTNVRTTARMRVSIISPINIKISTFGSAKAREERIKQALETFKSLVRADLNTRVTEYIKKFGALYPNGASINFPIFYQTYLSPLFIEVIVPDSIRTHERNRVFLSEKQEVLRRFKNEMPKFIESVFGETILHDPKKGFEFPNQNKKIFLNFYIAQTNNPINWSKNFTISVGEGNADSNQILRGVGGELWHLALLFAEKNKEVLASHAKKFAEYKAVATQEAADKKQVKDLVNQCATLKATYNKQTEKVAVLRKYAKFLQRKYPDPTSAMSKQEWQTLDAVRTELAAGNELTTELPVEAQQELALKITASKKLCEINTVSFLDRFGKWVGRIFAIDNDQLHKCSLEVTCVGSKGMTLHSCKSSRDRTGVAFAAADVTFRDGLKNPEVIQSDAAKTGAFVQQLSHAFNSQVRYGRFAKLSDVAKKYVALVSDTARSMIKRIKFILKPSKKSPMEVLFDPKNEATTNKIIYGLQSSASGNKPAVASNESKFDPAATAAAPTASASQASSANSFTAGIGKQVVGSDVVATSETPKPSARPTSSSKIENSYR